MTSALAASERVFVEQRLSTRAAALELFWVFAAERLGVELAQDISGQDGRACRRLRGLLHAAHIDTHIPDHCDLLLTYADTWSLADGPRVVTHIRNRLAHPTETEQLYQLGGLVSQAADLAGRYLDLLLLWELGYEGHVMDRTKHGGWAGDSNTVPWSSRA